MFLVVGAVLLVTTFLILVGLVSLFALARRPNASVSTPSVSDLPHELALCDNFKPGTIVLIDLGKGDRRYTVNGDCPVSALALKDTYETRLQSLGWIVHNDGNGNFVCYEYERKEVLTAAVTDSSSTANQSSLSVDMVTGQEPPSDFPKIKPSPSPSPSPRPSASPSPKPSPSPSPKRSPPPTPTP
jgi:hypothetical protein